MEPLPAALGSRNADGAAPAAGGGCVCAPAEGASSDAASGEVTGAAEVLALDVGLAYREGAGQCHALRAIRLGLRAPGFVGIAGPSGSGKSSLLYVLAGLKRPTAGRVLALGRDLGRLVPTQRCALRRGYFGFVFQQPFLIHFLTALENVMVGARRPDRAARRRAQALLGRLGLGRSADRMPHELSGGQRQRVAAARALMNDPLIVFADEPTAALDHISGSDLMGLLHEYRRARGALLAAVSHDETVIAGADAVVRMWDGRIRRIESPEPAAAEAWRRQGPASAAGNNCALP